MEINKKKVEYINVSHNVNSKIQTLQLPVNDKNKQGKIGCYSDLILKVLRDISVFLYPIVVQWQRVFFSGRKWYKFRVARKLRFDMPDEAVERKVASRNWKLETTADPRLKACRFAASLKNVPADSLPQRGFSKRAELFLRVFIPLSVGCLSSRFKHILYVLYARFRFVGCVSPRRYVHHIIKCSVVPVNIDVIEFITLY